MRVNVYAEEMTERVEVVTKQGFTGLRLYLELPATVNGVQHRGPFQHGPNDDDSSAVTFWGKRDLRKVLRLMLETLDAHYESRGFQDCIECSAPTTNETGYCDGCETARDM